MDKKGLWLQRIVLNPSSRRLFSACLFLALIVPSVILAGLYFHRIKTDLTAFSISRKQATAKAVALMLKERLDRLNDLGSSLAARVYFQKYIAEGNWEEAIRIMEKIPEKFEYIDRIFLTDPQGILMAETPSLNQTVGESFAHRDWYKGVSKEWELYISEVYQRKAQPTYNVVAIAVPIAELADPQHILGILVLQMRLETFSTWTKDIDIESGGIIIIVDRTGKVVAHPEMDLTQKVVDYSPVPATQEILKGKGGYSTFFNNIEGKMKSTVYEVVPHHQWGVIISHSEANAFLMRDEILKSYGVVFLIFIILNIMLIFAILNFVLKLAVSDVALKRVNEDLEMKVRERTRHLEIANEKLKANHNALMQTNQDLEQFAYVASHDLQEPLRKIVSFTQLFAKKYLPIVDDEGRQFIDFIIKGAERMQSLIKDLLDYSRSSGGELKLQSIDLNKIMEEAKLSLMEAIDRSRASVTYDRLPTVRANPVLMTRVFENLIGNALKYCKDEAPRVHILSEEHEHEWIIVVSDNGIGIDERYHQRIFQIFERLHTDEEYSGTGIGLAIVRRIVERHGGKIWVESAAKGTIFKFSLPKEPRGDA